MVRFGAEFKSFRNRDAELPYDNHYLHAMVAPRGLLLTEGYEDTGANPAGTYLAARSAEEVYKLLGAEGKSTATADSVTLLEIR